MSREPLPDLTLFGLKQCSTCVKACRWLDNHNLSFIFVDYRDQPVAPTLLKQWAEQLGGWEKLVNRASQTWRNLDESRKSPESDQAWTDLIGAYPALVRRPVAVSADGEVSVGFSEKRYLERFVDRAGA